MKLSIDGCHTALRKLVVIIRRKMRITANSDPTAYIPKSNIALFCMSHDYLSQLFAAMQRELFSMNNLFVNSYGPVLPLLNVALHSMSVHRVTRRIHYHKAPVHEKVHEKVTL